uniref:Uncharacterized protein n=1 Tax=Coturnix japonica TaxID=93934 RepID=A0A8C2YCG8_COTJA
MSSTGCTSKLLLVLTSLLLVLPAVEAMDAGDTIAFLLGLAVSVIGFCACLGKLEAFIFLLDCEFSALLRSCLCVRKAIYGSFLAETQVYKGPFSSEEKMF